MKIKILIAFISIFFINCSKPSPETIAPTTINSSFPFLNINKYSNFKAIQLGSIVGSLKVTVGNYEENGFLVTETKYDPNGVEISTDYDLWKEENGYIKLYNHKSTLDVSRIYKLNPILNESWQDINSNGETVTHRVVDIDSLITVPAGSFHCKVIKFELSSGVNESYTFWNDEYGKIQEDIGYIRIKLDSHN
jgi:hypothetical protein